MKNIVEIRQNWTKKGCYCEKEWNGQQVLSNSVYW